MRGGCCPGGAGSGDAECATNRGVRLHQSPPTAVGILGACCGETSGYSRESKSGGRSVGGMFDVGVTVHRPDANKLVSSMESWYIIIVRAI